MLQGGSHQFDGDGLDQACVGLKAGRVPSIRQMSLLYPFIQRHGGQPRHIGTRQYPAVQGMVRQRYDPPVVGVKRSLLRVVNGQCEAQFQAGDQGGGQHQFSPLNTAQGAEENVALAGKTRVKDAPCTDVVLMTPEPCPAGECYLLEGDDGVIHHGRGGRARPGWRR